MSYSLTAIKSISFSPFLSQKLLNSEMVVSETTISEMTVSELDFFISPISFSQIAKTEKENKSGINILASPDIF